MSNLLPLPEQHQIRQEYRARSILAGSFLAMGMALFTVLALSPSYGVLYVTRPAALVAASFVQQSKDDSADIARAQALVVQLKPVTEATSTVSTLIESILNKRSHGIQIYGIAYTPRTGSAQANISISGNTDGRDSINAFRTALEEDPRYTSVNIPVGNLIRASGSDFTISLTGTF